MPSISNDFLLGGVFGFFLYHYFFVFLLGLTSGILIIDNFGSLTNFCVWLFHRARDNFNQVYHYYFLRNIPDDAINQEILNNDNIKKDE